MRILRDDPLLLVFVVAAVGYLAGRIRIAGFGFGVAAVLFAGLAFGMADPQLQVPRSVWTLGLVLFVYTVGLAAGPGFVAAFRRRGVGANVLVFAAVAAAAGTVTIVGAAVGLGPEETAGAFAGGLTNTPALAASLEALRDNEPGQTFDAAAGRVLVGYSLGYPAGVTVALLAVFAVVRRRGRAEPVVGPTAIVVRTALVQHAGLGTLEQVRERSHDTVAFGRVKRGSALFAATDDIELAPGDLVTVVGPENAVDAAIAVLGSTSSERVELDLDRRRFQAHRRIKPRHRRAHDRGR